ncbi:AAA family ATPase [Nocardioides cynanchi]|uniref:AAA family ATPase n=1 Tax=Nocardioides cynanchi TaxID=2558918 RepID=UPI001248A63C|nr:SMC family ATPase [Nocardioides cynanchi]
MRIQRLRISGFGPFAESVDLDFAALNDAGLFLLAGSNGAGKSSILDAVCFALYAAVPGERNTARRFRSDHAAPDQAPTVELEATFAEGTYRVVRTAAWERPKRRGTGTTTQQATVSVSRRVGDEWRPVTSRLDEAGQLITRLVGMNLTQFCQVVILPQGRFQAFLQATATERQALLQQLFHTGRFQRVEGWLREHRLALRRTSLEHETAVAEVVNRISEVAGAAVPAPESDPLAWAAGLCDDLSAVRAAADRRSAEAVRAEARTRAALESGRDVAARLARLEAARAEQASLRATAPEIEAVAARVDRARRAAQVAVLTPLVEAREAAQAAATEARDAATGRLATALGSAPDDPTAHRDVLRAAVQRFHALVPRSDEAQALRDEQAAIVAALDALDTRCGALESSDVEAVISTLAAQQDAAHDARLALPDVRLEIDERRALLRAHDQVESLAPAHAQAVSALAVATAQALDAREVWLAVREARIDGMAAELAGALAVGADCPVCGSHDHPHPARPHHDAPDAEAERVALRAVDDANAVQHAHDQQVRELATALEQARALAGETSIAELRSGLTSLRARTTELEGIVDRGAEAAPALAAARERRGREAEERQAVRERSASLREGRDRVAQQLAVLDAKLAEALAGTPYSDARTAHDETARMLTEVEAALRAEGDLVAAVRSLAEASGARLVAALEAGFDSVAEAEAALLRPVEIEQHVRDLDRHSGRLTAVARQLADPALQDLDDLAAPDVAALEAEHLTSEETRAAAVADAETQRRRLSRLDALLTDLAGRHADWEPVRSDLEVAQHLSAFCEGKAPDNRWQIQLSAYVVAWRLSQVADAANLRLAVLTSGRYSLEHTDLRGAGERRGGMTLVVRDEWTGVTRDPVTLSGGESFVVALALALGLADVITAEAGGAALQTLFVDEGFGMLDATSLDLVMDTLDSLRESGRTVGVVSHVAEMRSRIPVQVLVDKPRDHGPSTVRLRA